MGILFFLETSLVIMVDVDGEIDKIWILNTHTPFYGPKYA